MSKQCEILIWTLQSIFSILRERQNNRIRRPSIGQQLVFAAASRGTVKAWRSCWFVQVNGSRFSHSMYFFLWMIQRLYCLSTWFSLGQGFLPNMSTTGFISRLSRHASPSFDHCGLPELLCDCHEPAGRDIYYMGNYERLCLLRCNLSEVNFTSVLIYNIVPYFKQFFIHTVFSFFNSYDVTNILMYVGLQFVNSRGPSQQVCWRHGQLLHNGFEQ